MNTANQLLNQLLSNVLNAALLVFVSWVGVLFYRNKKLRDENANLKKNNLSQSLLDIHNTISNDSIQQLIDDTNKGRKSRSNIESE